MKQKIGRLLEYDNYDFSVFEWVRYLGEGFIIQGMIAYLFYQSIIAMFLLSPLTYLYIRNKKLQLINERKQTLQLQFKEAILAVSYGLQAGYSIENAFEESLIDMKLLYGKDSLISNELTYLTRQLKNNIVLEQLLISLAKRSQVDDVKDFAEIFQIAKRRGGGLSEIIRTTTNTISQKIELKTDIATLLSAKKYEQKIMNAVPFFIIFYIGITSPGFFAPLYHNIMGITIMTICLVIYVIAVMLANKIISIGV